ncbi:hypothetical protein M514_04504 [Trichuris suis]|uniref:Kelch repeat protein n=1 Tax=Trichuris suis TaxID=68888 RepID=A0A085N600_9BILA|nr:hypothetical protein M514_04504 [Trichuris suis]
MSGASCDYSAMSTAFLCRSPAVEQFASCSDGAFLYLFGGARFDGTFVNELFQFSLENHWIILPASGSIPKPRVESSLTCANSTLYLFGGVGPDGSLLNDFYSYDLVRNVWIALCHVNGFAPSPRRLCGFAASKDAIFLYGGDVGSNSSSIVSPHFRSLPSSSGEFFSFTFETANWKQITCTDGCEPPPLRACTLIWAYNGCILFGGENNLDSSTGSTYLYNPEKQTWTLSSSNAISCRCSVSAVVYMDRFIIAYGGRDADDFELDELLIYDTNADVWMKSNSEECEMFIAEVGCRYSHGSAMLTDSRGHSWFFLFGGVRNTDVGTGIPQTQLTDSYLLPADALLRSTIPYEAACHSASSSSCSAHVSNICNDCIEI